MYKSSVFVTLKPTVNDPQGLTIKSGLQTLGFNSVESVRAGKYLEITLDAPDITSAKQQINDMCQNMLANLIIEDFRFDVTEISS